MILLIFPHQLFQKHPGLNPRPQHVALIEDSLFFGDPVYPAKFHKQKLWLHRATMKRYQATLDTKNSATSYFDFDPKPGSLKRTLKKLAKKSSQFCVIDPTDFILEKRILNAADELGLQITFLPNPGFLNQTSENQEFRSGKKRWFMADFYKWQRRRMNLLIDEDGQPTGGKWSYDDQNRKKVPKKRLGDIPSILKLKRDEFDAAAIKYVEKRFPKNPGSLNRLIYPSSHQDAKKWLRHFLKHRFEEFGPYEDAIVENESWLWHSVLTPALNIGLLTPKEILASTLKHMEQHDVPLNSSEGFIRQVIGWREFMRATYEDLGVTMRNSNHWDHTRTIPDSFYLATTGIVPIDDTIDRLNATGYCHHIERLMVLGGFMFLCEFHPKQIYRWFMEMFIDSYDWVMVPNVFSMSQHADGGLTTTKPYFSGSSYIRKMSHYPKGPWCEIWDGLYWRWIWKHNEQLSRNPRWAMMCSMAKKMDAQKRENHLKVANQFLDSLN